MQEKHEAVLDLIFLSRGPTFGDLFTICGFENPNFPPEGYMDFQQFEALQFSQVDDYFGVRTTSGAGDDVAIWLFPLVDADVVDHHPGPFDGLRLSYDVLRNPIERSAHFVRVVEEFSQNLPVEVRRLSCGSDHVSLRREIDAIAGYWAAQGIEVGSDAAMTIGC